jgi:non-ribosomal peptide synthase protein (TIGR01720 family)
MVPAAFVVLDALPLSPNGKVDRQALPPLDPTHLAAGTEYVPPSGPVEERLARIAAEVLRRDRIGADDNIFDLGLDSILSIQIAARARQAGLEFNPGLLFQHPTIAEIATHVFVATRDGESRLLAATGPVPLTPVQHSFFARALPDPQHATEAVWLDVSAPFEPERIAEAVRHLVRHHDALRLRFTGSDSGDHQASVAEEAPESFVRFDLAALADADRGPALSLLAGGIQRGLDLANGPVVRVALFEFGPDRPARLLVIIHQLVVDRPSWRVLLEDLATVHQALARGEPVVLRPPTTSYREWVYEQSHKAGADEGDDDAAYWLAADHAAVGGLPLDFGDDREPGTSDATETLTITFDDEESRALFEDVSEAYGTHWRDAVLTALTEALTRWTGQEAVALELEGEGRDDRPDLERTAGCFTTLFPVTLELPPDPGPAAALKAIREQLRAAPRHGVGSALIDHRAKPGVAGATRGSPRPSVRFRCATDLDSVLPEGSAFAISGATTQHFRDGVAPPSAPLEIEAIAAPRRMSFRWIYSAARFHRSTIERVADEFQAALRALVAHCQSPAARGYTPSDFPLAGLDQRTLDQLVLTVEDGAEEGLE